MADFPALPLWTDAFLSDTTHLSRDEVGAYLLLLMTAWRRPAGSLPDDDAFLARVARCDMRTWRSRMRPLMMQFWKIQDGEWTQKRLTAEREYVNKRAAVSRTNGKRGGRPNSNNNNDLENPAGTLEETRQEPTHTHNHIDSVGDKSPTGAVAPEAPDKPVFDRGRQLLGKSAGGKSRS